jgi:hypothetical protein
MALPTSTKSSADSSFRDALTMLALGCPVELTIPHRWPPIVVWPDDYGPAARLLPNHPEIRVDLPAWARPTDDALRGEMPTYTRRPVRRSDTPVGHAERPIGGTPQGGWPIDRVVAALGALGYLVRKRRPRQWRAKCPYHGGRSGTSLSLLEREDGSLWVGCFSGCYYLDILAVLGLTADDLQAPDPEQIEARKTVLAILERIRQEVAA